MVEPEPDLVGVIHPLARPGIEGPATRDDDARRGAQRVDGGLLERGWPDVRGEGFAVDGAADPPVGLARDDFYPGDLGLPDDGQTQAE